MAETLGCVGADLGLPDPRGEAFFLGLLGAEDTAAVAAGTWLVSSDIFLNSGASEMRRPKTATADRKAFATDERNSRAATGCCSLLRARRRRGERGGGGASSRFSV